MGCQGRQELVSDLVICFQVLPAQQITSWRSQKLLLRSSWRNATRFFLRKVYFILVSFILHLFMVSHYLFCLSLFSFFVHRTILESLNGILRSRASIFESIEQGVGGGTDQFALCRKCFGGRQDWGLRPLQEAGAGLQVGDNGYQNCSEGMEKHGWN